MKRALLRGVPWPPLLAMTAAGGLLLGAATAAAPHSWLGARLVGLGFAVLAGAAAYSLDEPAAAVVDATPCSLRVRTLVRTTVLSIPLTVTAFVLAGNRIRHSSTPFWGLYLELVGVTAVAVAGAASARRRHPTPGEPAASTVAVLIVAVSVYDPLARWVPLLPTTPDGHWGRTAAAWSLSIAASVLVLARASRDPLDA